jgi:hypothetical protein
LFGVKLEVTVVVPLLKGEGEALVMEELWIKVVFSVGRDKDDLIKMGALGIPRAHNTFGFSVGDGANFE